MFISYSLVQITSRNEISLSYTIHINSIRYISTCSKKFFTCFTLQSLEFKIGKNKVYFSKLNDLHRRLIDLSRVLSQLLMKFTIGQLAQCIVNGGVS